MGVTSLDIGGEAGRDDGEWPAFAAGKEKGSFPSAGDKLRTIERCNAKEVGVDDGGAAEPDILDSGVEVR